MSSSRRCPSCGAPRPPAGRSCPSCGGALPEPLADPTTRAAAEALLRAVDRELEEISEPRLYLVFGLILLLPAAVLLGGGFLGFGWPARLLVAVPLALALMVFFGSELDRARDRLFETRLRERLRAFATEEGIERNELLALAAGALSPKGAAARQLSKL